MDEFLVHSSEQVLRFTRVNKWDELSEERKVQLGYNMGAFAHALELPKEQSFDMLTKAREGRISMSEFRNHLKAIIEARGISVDEAKVARPF